jgi:1-acyl-sn-glycerol-3-phosphate acyltransferase
MSVWGAFAVVTAVLFAPWALMPRRRDDELSAGVRLLWCLNALYCRVWHGLEVGSDPPLPGEGPAILISNHTCCVDHVILQASTRRLLGFMIAKELYDFGLYHPFVSLGGCIPVKRDGRDLAATRSALRALESGRVLPIFPEGRILPTSGRELGPGKPGVAFLAAHARVPVIPAYICGTPETNRVVRSFLTPSRARVDFGPPIDLSDLWETGRNGRDHLDLVTERLMGAIRRLRDEVAGQPRPSQDPLPDGVRAPRPVRDDDGRSAGDLPMLPRSRVAS